MPTGHTHIKLKGVLLDSPLGAVVTLDGAYLNPVDTLLQFDVLPFAGGVGIGLGFTFALTLLGMVRELLGAGSLFGFTLLPEALNILIFVLPPGAFISLGFLIAIVNKIRKV